MRLILLNPPATIHLNPTVINSPPNPDPITNKILAQDPASHNLPSPPKVNLLNPLQTANLLHPSSKNPPKGLPLNPPQTVPPKQPANPQHMQTNPTPDLD